VKKKVHLSRVFVGARPVTPRSSARSGATGSAALPALPTLSQPRYYTDPREIAFKIFRLEACIKLARKREIRSVHVRSVDSDSFPKQIATASSPLRRVSIKRGFTKSVLREF